jgi:hypothetical protein
MKRVILLLLIILIFSSANSVCAKGRKPGSGRPIPAAATPSVIPAATISIYFGRQSLRENDWVPVEVWISNNSDVPLQNISLEISAPPFMHWYDQNSCGPAELPKNTLTDAQIPAHKTVPHKLCLHTDNEIEVGDFNIPFSMTYEWNDNSQVKQAFVTTEKTIKVNLFGSESVAGVPLALAGFLVPGLFFWIFLRIWKVPWNQEATKELIYSVLISVVVIGLGYSLQQLLPQWRWLKYLDIRNGISGTKLFALASAGIVLGNIVGASYFAWMRWRMAKIISPSDPLITQVLKIVNQNSRATTPKTTVRLKNAAPFVGSLGASSQGSFWLAGWFKIDIRLYANDARFTAKMNRYLAAGNNAKMLRLARKKKLQLQENEQITQNSTPKGLLLNWNEDELSGQPQKIEDQTVKRLLELVQ